MTRSKDDSRKGVPGDGPSRSNRCVRHTPGPWTIKDARRLLRSDKDCDYGRKPISDPEVEANARLIAVAPELLAALQAMLHALDMRLPAGEHSLADWARKGAEYGSQKVRDEARATLSAIAVVAEATGEAA